MIQALSWYRVLAIGGLIALGRVAGSLGHEIRCIVAGRNEERLFQHTRPAVALLALTATSLFGIVLFILSITLILPILMLVAHLTGKVISRTAIREPMQDAGIQPETVVVSRNWHYYDGIMYETIINPILFEAWRETADRVPSGSRVVDICSGTGGLVFLLADKCHHVTGIDHARGMIEYSRRSQQRRALQNVTFVHADARCLRDYNDREFDYAVLSLALHEMPENFRGPVLKEATRVAEEIIIADYTVPLPHNPTGLMCAYLEVAAGLRHFKGFLDYSRRRGLDPLIEQAALAVESETSAMSGCVRVVKAANRSFV